MKPETDPITDDEWVLRRIHRQDFSGPSLPFVSPNGFRPRTSKQGRDIDTDGISLYRESCVAAPSDILVNVAADKLADQGIVRLSVRFLRSLGLTITPSPDAIPGHVVIPQLNDAAYISAKANALALMAKLASEASKEENIVRRPDARG